MSPEEIRKIFHTEYGLDARDISLVQEGYVNDVYKVFDGSRSYAFRIAKEEKSEQDAFFEVEVHSFLHKNNFPVPRIMENKRGAQINYLAQEWISGPKVICDLEHKPDIPVCRNAGRVLGHLHAVTSDFRPMHPPVRHVDDELSKFLAQKDAILAVFDGGEVFVEAAEKVMADLGKFAREQRLVHNDFRAQNLILREDGEIAAVLDFDWACMGEPLKDLAHALVEWSYPDAAAGHWTDCWDAFRSGYAESMTIDDKDIRFWVLFSCLSDASSYFLSRAHGTRSREKADRLKMDSYMFAKYKYFEKIL